MQYVVSMMHRRLISMAIVAVGGILFGIGTIVLNNMPIKWLAYFIGALVVLAFALLVDDKGTVFWATFVLSFQFDVYIYFLHGHAGSAGLMLSLPLFAGLVVVAYALWTRWYRDSGGVHFWGVAGWPVSAVLVTSLVAAVFTKERFVSLGGMIVQAQYLFFYLVAMNSIRTRERFQQTIKWLLVTLVVQSLVIYAQSGLGVSFDLTGTNWSTGRPAGTVAHHPSGFVSFVLPLLLLALAFAIGQTVSRGRRLRASAMVAMGVVGLFLTFTRAAWGGLFVGAVALMFLAYKRRFVSRRGVLAFGLCMGAVGMLLGGVTASRRSDSTLGSAYETRAGLAEIAVRVIKANPITGVGPGGYGHQYKTHVTGNEGIWLSEVHNYFLMRGAETGIPGLIGFVMLLVQAVRMGSRVASSSIPVLSAAGLAFTASIAAWSFLMLWDQWHGFTYQALLWFLLGVMEAALRLDVTPAMGRYRGGRPATSGVT